MLSHTWIISLVAAAIQLLSRSPDQAMSSADVSLTPMKLDNTLMSFAPRSDDRLSLDQQTQPELSDVELWMMVGQGFSTGDKRTEPQPYRVQLCEFTEFTGGGMLTSSWRAKYPGCSCERNEMKYGTANDRGIGFARMPADSFGYLRNSCFHSVGVYR